MPFGIRLSYEAERQLGRDMVSLLEKSIAPVLMAERRHVLSANRVSRLLEQSLALATDFKAQRGLGFIGKSVLAKSFKDALERSGYPDDFVKVSVEGLIVELSRPTKRPA